MWAVAIAILAGAGGGVLFTLTWGARRERKLAAYEKIGRGISTDLYELRRELNRQDERLQRLENDRRRVHVHQFEPTEAAAKFVSDVIEQLQVGRAGPQKDPVMLETDEDRAVRTAHENAIARGTAQLLELARAQGIPLSEEQARQQATDHVMGRPIGGYQPEEESASGEFDELFPPAYPLP